MNTVELSEAEARFSELVDEVEAGASIDITRSGRAVARLSPVAKPRKPIDAALLRSVTEAMPLDPEGAAKLVRALRDDARY